MQEGLSLFLSKSGIGVIKHKPNSSKEITFARPISADNDIMSRTEGFNYDLVFVRLEALNCQLKIKTITTKARFNLKYYIVSFYLFNIHSRINLYDPGVARHI